MGAAESEAVETVGRYEVVGRLAMGGMAEILLGRLRGPSGFERPVVIKRILPHLAEQGTFVDMFLDEARLAARIQHRNVVQVHELGREGNDLFLVMEYLEGENAAGLIRRSLVAGADLHPAICAYIVAEACSGLHSAHELTDTAGNPLNLVHRDVSPQNIFVAYNGAVKVLDFGIAKAADRTAHTEVGQLKGKFEYMSPEQCRGKPIDRRSDIFALGIVLYELVTRRRLFKRATKLAVLEAVCRDPIVPPSSLEPLCPPSLDAVILRALSKRADERYATAADLRRDLLGVVRELLPGDPEEALAGLMNGLFQDRIAEKRDMLNQVRAGAAVGALPGAEADSAVEIPDVEGMEHPSMAPRGQLESGFTMGHSHPGSGMDALAMAEHQARQKLLIRVSGAGLGVVVLGIIVFLWSMPRSDGVALRAGTNALMPPMSVLPKPKPPPPPPPATTVTIHVVSVPEGATVLVGGEEKGKTPLKLELGRGDEPVEVTLQHDGYTDSVEKVTPDVTQRLRVTLSKKKKLYFPGGGKPQTGGGFHRFD